MPPPIDSAYPNESETAVPAVAVEPPAASSSLGGAVERTGADPAAGSSPGPDAGGLPTAEATVEFHGAPHAAAEAVREPAASTPAKRVGGPPLRRRGPAGPVMTVGPFNVEVPGRPPGSTSRKSHAHFQRIWADNYREGFDRATGGQDPGGRSGPGSAREGRLKGYADGLARKAASSVGETPPSTDPGALAEVVPQVDRLPSVPGELAIAQADEKARPETSVGDNGCDAPLSANTGATRAEGIAVIDAAVGHAMIELELVERTSG